MTRVAVESRMETKTIPMICEQCGDTFYVGGRNSPTGAAPQKFCSRRCYGEHRSSRPQKNTLDRLADKFTVGDGCWEWTGAIQPGTGYSALNVGTVDGKKIITSGHRVLYELFNGPIPEGTEIDHLCRNRTCVRPAHLEAVTRSENNRRAWPFRDRGKWPFGPRVVTGEGE